MARSPHGLRLWVGGDVHLGAERGHALLAPHLARLAVGAGIVNLEGPVSSRETRRQRGRVALFNHPDALSRLVGAGVRVAGIANNHRTDAGPDGTTGTGRALRGRGIGAAGAPIGSAHLDQDGWRVGVAAFDVTSSPAVAMARELDRVRSDNDVLVVLLHDTGPPSYLPSARLERAVAVALAAGAAVVAAHGTHAVARVERRGAAVIAWGLGNLAFACDCTRDREGLLLLVVKTARRLRAAVIPIEADLRGGPAHLSPDPAGVVDLLRALGSSALRRDGALAWLDG